MTDENYSMVLDSIFREGQMARSSVSKIAGPKTPNDSQPIYAITQQPNVFVTMRDGVQLWTTLYLPVLPTGGTRPPCVLLADGYGAARDLPFLPAATGLAQRGYPVVFARLRGEL